MKTRLSLSNRSGGTQRFALPLWRWGGRSPLPPLWRVWGAGSAGEGTDRGAKSRTRAGKFLGHGRGAKRATGWGLGLSLGLNWGLNLGLTVGLHLGLPLGLALGWAEVASGADRLTAVLGPLRLSLDVADLEHYAATGETTPELDSYLRIATPAQQRELRNLLRQPVNLSHTVVSYLAYSPTGEVLLAQMGEIFKTGSGQNGAIALRAAVVNAAVSPEGLTLVNMLRQFPTPELRMDLRSALALAQEAVHLFFEDRQALVDAVAATAQQEAIGNGTDFSQMPDLRQPGVFTWETYPFEWQDGKRGDRLIPTDLYVPQRAQPAPVIILSHGVGNNRTSMQYLAEHWVSHGFVVVVPEHVGSNETLVRNVFAGLTQAQPREALDRLEDVRLVLDRLNTMSRLDLRWRGRFDFDRVGIAGQSFGAYTALALGGAQVSFPAMTQICAPDRLGRSLNLSLLLQCRILELAPQVPLPSQLLPFGSPDSALPRPRALYGAVFQPLDRRLDFGDPRIKAVMAMNPFTSAAFGSEGLAYLDRPLLMVSSGNDVVVPPGPEQLYAFADLLAADAQRDADSPAPDRYLALLEQGSHFSVLEELPPEQAVFAVPPALLGPDPTVAQDYMKALGLAFMTTYLTDSEAYRPYLNAAYGRYLSRDPMPLQVVQRLDRRRLDLAREARRDR